MNTTRIRSILVILTGFALSAYSQENPATPAPSTDVLLWPTMSYTNSCEITGENNYMRLCGTAPARG